MKKLFIFTILFMLVFKAFPIENASLEVEEPIILLPGYYDPTDLNNDYPRGPIKTPQAYLQGHSISIYGITGDYSVQLLNADGGVAYNTTVNASTGHEIFLLPTTLLGDYEMHIHIGSQCFYGMVNIY